MKTDIKTQTYQPLNISKLDEIQVSAQEYTKVMTLQFEVLRLIASGSDLDVVLNRLCYLGESMLEGSVASIMIQNIESQLLQVAAAPSIPVEAIGALDGLRPGVNAGSCGNAVYLNEPMYVQNTFEDDRWQDLRQLAIDFNICSCWSMPIRNEKAQAIGSFALSSFEHRLPSAFHKLVLHTCASIVEIALKKDSQDSVIQTQLDKLTTFAVATEYAAEGIVITNYKNDIIEVNPACSHIYGYKAAEMLGKNPKMFSSGNHDSDFYKDMWSSLSTMGTWSGEVRNRRSDGSLFYQWMSITRIPAKEEQDIKYIALLSDISELKDAQEKLGKIAYYDVLTNLGNKNRLEQVFDNNSNEMTLVLLNIDNFHYLNTVYGFSFGDKILVEVSKILKQCIYTDEVFRTGGDEFGLLYYNTSSMTTIIRSIQQKFIDRSIVIDDVKINISFSYGVSYGQEKLYENAIFALKRAKELGKNQFYVYDKEADFLNRKNKKNFIVWSKRLFDALENSNIIPYFQGIRDNNSGLITKFEVLARLNFEGEIYTPYHFIEPARLSGLLPRLTKTIIDKSFAIMQQNNYDFSINISEEDLNAEYLLSYLKDKIALYDIDPKRITLEILEGINSTKDHLVQLNALKAAGYALAIDDFGVENSNYARLLDLEVDYLKIDAEYIKNIDTDEKSREITDAIVYFAKKSGIKCVAEYVHSQAVQDVILDLEIEYSQGFIFSKPNKIPQSQYLN